MGVPLDLPLLRGIDPAVLWMFDCKSFFGMEMELVTFADFPLESLSDDAVASVPFLLTFNVLNLSLSSKFFLFSAISARLFRYSSLFTRRFNSSCAFVMVT
jgi:hypothetical protein